MTWRAFFSYPNGLERGHSEEKRYQAYKARFLEEMRKEKERAALEAQRIHEEAMEAALGPHGQG
jgi:uncharacterized protein YeaO (DUF488 family)